MPSRSGGWSSGPAPATCRGWTVRPPVLADYPEQIASAEVWVLQDQPGQNDPGHLVGLLVLVPHPDHLLLDTVAVSPARQQQGLGRRLIRHAEARSGELGLPEVRLYTNEAMIENQAYYTRLGYAETRRSEQDGYRRVFYARPVALPG